METKVYGDRLETLKKQFQTEREVTKKAAQKESAEVRKGRPESPGASHTVMKVRSTTATTCCPLWSISNTSRIEVRRSKCLAVLKLQSKSKRN